MTASVDVWKCNSLLILPKANVADFLQNKCSYKFGNVHKKVPVLQFHFSKVAGFIFIKKDSNTGAFLWVLKKFYRTPLVAASVMRSEAFCKTPVQCYFWCEGNWNFTGN